MHLPGYIQEGREADNGYLLLGVYHRNSPSCTSTHIVLPIKNKFDTLNMGFLEIFSIAKDHWDGHMVIHKIIKHHVSEINDFVRLQTLK
jgi:hypothetical protein